MSLERAVHMFSPETSDLTPRNPTTAGTREVRADDTLSRER